MELFQEH